ncbi:unnamed protein product [Phytomonas sp. Hart1]|nr:unnamed protein product [Phytomonas sp. Hart1]|eukprot:CCW68516.1 unnamed protein product [Phytomonas sp. isolate Hart1]
MQAQMVAGRAIEQFCKKEFANLTLGQCWEVCYDRNLSRAELASGEVAEAKVSKMDACARKCVSRNFEVMRLIMESRETREKEAIQAMGV